MKNHVPNYHLRPAISTDCNLRKADKLLRARSLRNKSCQTRVTKTSTDLNLVSILVPGGPSTRVHFYLLFGVFDGRERVTIRSNGLLRFNGPRLD